VFQPLDSVEAQRTTQVGPQEAFAEHVRRFLVRVYDNPDLGNFAIASPFTSYPLRVPFLLDDRPTVGLNRGKGESIAKRGASCSAAALIRPELVQIYTYPGL
jgi:hypothetical protein